MIDRVSGPVIVWMALCGIALFWAVVLLFLEGCARAPAPSLTSGNPNCLWHCVTDQVDAPRAATVNATQSGATSVSRTFGGGP